MMEKFSTFLIKHRKFIFALTIVAIILSVVGTVLLVTEGKINSDMMEYLPDDSETKKGLEFLQKNFGIKGDAMYVVEGTKEDAELGTIINSFKSINGVTQVMWYGMLADLGDMGSDLGIPIEIDTTSMEKFLRQPIEGSENYNYVVIMMIDFGPSTTEAYAVIDEMNARLEGRHFASGGMTAMAKSMMNETLGEMYIYIIVGVLVVILILFLATSSYVEPLILIITLGVSIIINMGTNYFLPQISIISFAASSILQLGISMDYAIFFMHIYKEKRQEMDSLNAIKKSLPITLITVVASSLTTIGGFMALMFMQFTIGADIGIVIAKGVFFSLFTVILLQPILTYTLDKAIIKTTHKEIKINFEPYARSNVKFKKLIITLSAVLILPAVVTQSMMDLSYLKLFDAPQNPTKQEIMAGELGNQVIISVPLLPKTGKTHKDFIAEIKTDPKIGSVMGAYEIMDIDPLLLSMGLDILESSGKLGSDISSFFSKVTVNKKTQWYTLYTLSYKGSTEDEQAFKTYDHLTGLVKEYFDDGYTLGMLTGTMDMAKITPVDFNIVTIVSVLIILLVLMVMMKSFKKSFLMVLLIELGIWINLGIQAIMGQQLNFMVYILISSVQLGCTVDYAILMVKKFDDAQLKFKDTKEAVVYATKTSMPAVITSAGIIMGACLSVYFVSTNLIVKEMTYVLARGGFISMFLVLTVLPGLMYFFKKSDDASKERRRHFKMLLKSAKKNVKASRKKIEQE